MLSQIEDFNIIVFSFFLQKDEFTLMSFKYRAGITPTTYHIPTKSSTKTEPK